MSKSKSLNLSAAPTTSLLAFFRQLKLASNVESRDEGGIYRWHTPVPHPWFNGVLVDRPPSDSDRERIAEIQDFFERRGVNTFTWWVDHPILFESWAEPLQARGFYATSSTPGMALDLDRLPQTVSAPEEFTIQIITDPTAMAAWMEIFIPGYGLPLNASKPYLDMLTGIGLQLPWRHYLGWLDGKPVATASLFIDQDTAGIFNVAVLPDARRKGLGTAITLLPLQEARRMGCRIGALQSSEMGYRVYERLGFEQTTMISNYFFTLT